MEPGLLPLYRMILSTERQNLNTNFMIYARLKIRRKSVRLPENLNVWKFYTNQVLLVLVYGKLRLLLSFLRKAFGRWWLPYPNSVKLSSDTFNGSLLVGKIRAKGCIFPYSQ